MAYHIVDAGAYALRETFVKEGSRNGIMVGGKGVYQMIDVGRAHAFSDILRHIVEQSSIDGTRSTYALQLLGSAQHRAGR